MTIKAQLDDATEEKQRLADELRRITEEKDSVSERYKTEQLKTRTLLEEMRRSKYKK